MQELHEMQVLANRYINDPTQEHPVWLHAKMDNETGLRRALVYSISIQFKSSWFGSEATSLDIPLVLSVVRSPYWERPTAKSLPDGAPSAAACVVYDYTAAGDAIVAHDIVGDVGARLRFFDLKTTGGGDFQSRFWIGFRSAGKHGATGISNFVNTWEWEDGVNNASESGITDQADGTASGGNRVQLVETDLDWDTDTFLKVAYITLGTVTANEKDNLGTFLWLLRAYVVSGTWEVRLLFGINSTTAIKSSIIELTNTDWGYTEMGIESIPIRNIHNIISSDIAFSAEDTWRVSIWARRTSGSGNLNIDCLIPIPIDEGFCKLDLGSLLPTYLSLGQSPEGAFSLIQRTGTPTVLDIIPPKSIENFVLPPGDGRIYCTYDKNGVSDILDAITFNDTDIGRYYERWLSLRGSK
jgi:hypothetical protein